MKSFWILFVFLFSVGCVKETVKVDYIEIPIELIKPEQLKFDYESSREAYRKIQEEANRKGEKIFKREKGKVIVDEVNFDIFLSTVEKMKLYLIGLEKLVDMNNEESLRRKGELK